MQDDEWPDLTRLDDLALGGVAMCSHACHCQCHRSKHVKHVMACCSGCGKGHSNINPMMLKDHLRKCHGVKNP